MREIASPIMEPSPAAVEAGGTGSGLVAHSRAAAARLRRRPELLARPVLQVRCGCGPRRRVVIERAPGGARDAEGFLRLWDDAGRDAMAVCADLCHAHAVGIPLDDLVRDLVGSGMRVGLIEVSDRRDAYGAGRDRHEAIGSGLLDVDRALDVAAALNVPVVARHLRRR